MSRLLRFTTVVIVLAAAGCGVNSSQADAAKAEKERTEAAKHFDNMEFARPEIVTPDTVSEQKKKKADAPASEPQ